MSIIYKWEQPDRLTPDRFAEARLEAHFAVQWLAKSAATLLPSQADFSHTSLTWEPDLSALVTQPLPTGRRPIRLALHVPGLCYQVLDDSGIIEEHPTTDRTHLDAGRWLQRVLSGLGAPVSALLHAPEFPDPDHYLARGDRSQAHRMGEGLRALGHWYGNAALVLAEAKATIDARRLEPGASAVRCWPHHFDMTTLVLLEPGDPETVRSLSLGFSPGDGTIGAPYFFVTPWPAFGRSDLPRLVPPGWWETDAFGGAVAPADSLLDLDDPYAATKTFLETTFERCLERMGRFAAVA